jgi:hypothetical protein
LPRPTSSGAFALYLVAGSTSNACTIHGTITSLNITGSGHTPFFRPEFSPRGIMAISVVMPALELTQETGKLVSWRKKEGEAVAKGETLLKVETDKAVLEGEALADGFLAGVKAKTCAAFVLIVLGAIAAAAGFGIFKFLAYIREEILIVAAVNTSEGALPTLREKLERLGCSRPLVGLVVPSGYIFNTDGTGVYMTLAALFVAQATNTHLTAMQQLTIFAVATLTSKGAGGVSGASFRALVATLTVVPTIPVASMALLLGIEGS